MSCIEFLKFCLDDKRVVPLNVNSIDWRKMLVWAEQQAIVGVILMGIQNADRALNIPFEVLMKWIGYANGIENQNRKLNRKCLEIFKEYEESNMGIMLLKGQGNALLYPKPLLRTPGDIDILVSNIDRSKLTNYAKAKDHLTGHHYHHIEYEDEGIPIEVHFLPCSMNNPLYHRRLQKWLRKNEERCVKELPEGEGKICVPTLKYNVVYQLAHMMHHFFDEGIGLRQMIDYYFLLKSENNNQVYGSRSKVNGYTENLAETLKYLNLYKFAGAVMYIMKEVLGLADEYLIVPIDERRGKTLLKEILKGGNFGHYSKLDQNNAAKKYFQKTWRNMQLVKEYPAEALCEPIFRTWHFFWRMAH